MDHTEHRPALSGDTFTTPEENSRQYRSGRLVAVFIGAGVVAAFQVGKVPPALPVLREALGLSLFVSGWVISIQAVIGALAGAMIGAFSDWLGHRRMMITGLSFLAFSSLGGAASSGATGLLISRFFEGFGFIAIISTAPSLITQMAAPQSLRLVLGIWGAFMPAGVALMIFISPVILKTLGWRVLWLGNAFICAAFAILTFKATRRMSESRAVHAVKTVKPFDNIKATLSSPGPLLLTFCFTYYTMQWTSMVGFLPTFFIEGLGLDDLRAALLTAIAISANIPGNILGGWLHQKEVPRWLLLSSSFVCMSLLTFAIFSYTGSYLSVFIFCLFFTGIAGVIPGVTWASVPIHAPRPELIGATCGLMMQGSNIGSMVGPLALAALVEATGGWQAAPWIFTLSGSLGLLMSLGMGRLESASYHSGPGKSALSDLASGK